MVVSRPANIAEVTPFTTQVIDGIPGGTFETKMKSIAEKITDWLYSSKNGWLN